MTKKIKNTSLVVALLLCVFVFLGAGVFLTRNAYAKENPFQAEYEMGETIVLPSGSVTVNGVEKEASTIIHYPNGCAYAQNSAKLDLPGKYTVEYRVVENGKVYKETYDFIVKYPAFTLSTKEDTAEYGSVAENVDGLLVTLMSGSTFSFNTVIDLSKTEVLNNMFSFYGVSGPIGENWELMYIRLTDAYDDTCFVDIRFRQAPNSYIGGNYDVVYLAACGDNQSQFYGTISDYNHGFDLTGSLKGYSFADEYEIVIGYNNTTKTVYSSGTLAADLTDLSKHKEAWTGIKSGYAKLSVRYEGLKSTSASFLVTGFADYEFVEPKITPEPSDIVVDFDKYNSDNYPSAVVGMPYKIFPATSYQTYTSEKIYANVYTKYNSQTPISVDVVDGAFIPKTAETHVIEYTVYDGYGNTRSVVIPVQVKAQATPINVELNTAGITKVAGETLELPTITVSGGEGILDVEKTIELPDGQVVVLESNEYRLINTGIHKLTYIITDYNGQEEKREIIVTSNNANKPIFGEKPNLPLRYITGKKYELPKIMADDFSTGSLQKINTQVKVTQNGSELTVADGYFTVGTGDVTLEFTATDSAGHTNSISYTVASVNPVSGSDICLDKYFIIENGTATPTNDYLSLKFSKNASYTFIRELLATSFEIKFNVPSSNKFKNITILLTDYNDSSRQISIDLAKKVSREATISINGSEPVDSGYKFGGDIKDFQIGLVGNVVTLGNLSIITRNTLNGQEFNGFANYAYCTISVSNVTGSSEMYLYELNRQPLYKMSYDVMEPRFSFSSAYGGDKEYNEIVELAPVFAIDVLDPYTELTFSVKLPGTPVQYATSEDGTLLKNVPCDRSYFIKLNAYGKYMVSYKAVDGDANQANFSYVINCIDTEAPTITPSKKEFSARLNSNVKIPDYTCSDNVTKNLSVYIQIIAPNGKITSCTDKEFKVDQAGKYIIRYYAIDENFNTTLVDVVVKVG